MWMKVGLPCVNKPSAVPELLGHWLIDGDGTKYAVGTCPLDHKETVTAFLNAREDNQHFDVRGLEDHYAKCQVSKEETQSVSFYTREGYHSINGYLRGPAGAPIDAGYQAHIDNIERFIEKLAPSNLNPLFRVMAAENGIDTFYERVHPGDILLDNGFTSTSKFPSVVKRLRGSPSTGIPLIYFRFENPTRAADISVIRPDQGEVLIQRKTHFEVRLMHKLGPHALLVHLRQTAGGGTALTELKDLSSGRSMPQLR